MTKKNALEAGGAKSREETRSHGSRIAELKAESKLLIIPLVDVPAMPAEMDRPALRVRRPMMRMEAELAHE